MSGDPYFNNVALLLHFDGSNGSTTFTDVTGKTISRIGTTFALSTAQAKFGTASGYFSASTSYPYTADNAVFTLGTGDFTVETWLYPTTLDSNARGIAGHRGTGTTSNFAWSLAYTQSEIRLQLGNTDGVNIATTLTFAYTFNLNVWQHVAICRNSGVIRCFVDGVQRGTDQNYSASIFNTTTPLGIGTTAFGSNAAMLGYMDDFRFTVGVGRYTGNFDPLTEAFPDFAENFDINHEPRIRVSNSAAFFNNRIRYQGL